MNHPNINVTLYDGKIQVGFDCAGEHICRFVLCSEMPPNGKEECFFKEYGSCRHAAAQYAALEKLHKRIKNELNKYKGEED